MHDQLRAACEQVEEVQRSVRTHEGVIFDFGHRESAALGRHRVAQAGLGLLQRQEGVSGLRPALAVDDGRMGERGVDHD